MKKITIMLAFLLTATLSNAQQADTIKTPLTLSHVMEFGHDNDGDRYYVLYGQQSETIEVYCPPEEFFDLLVWKSEYSGDDCETQMEIVYVENSHEYHVKKKETEKKGEA